MESAPAAKRPALWLSLLPVVALVALLYLNVQVFEATNNHLPLVLATGVAAVVALAALGRKWSDLEAGILHAIGMAMQACLILLVVGMLIAAWIQAGVVPLLIVYGLDIISPSIFLVTACAVCAIVSLATGSSWTTAGTVGVALIGVGTTLGLNPGMVAGAIVSGAYFGDKMSPLSDTTNLAPAMAGATLIEHVRHMVWTVTPALLIALALYALLGRGAAGNASLERVTAVTEAIRGQFRLSPWLLAPPVLTLVLVAVRFPALPALTIGTFLAVFLGLFVQPNAGLVAEFGRYLSNLYDGYRSTIGEGLPADVPASVRDAAATVDELLSNGGMSRMLNTIALIFCALAFGGVMERSGMLGAIADSVLKLVRGTGSLIAAVIFTCFGVNVLASDQYMAIVVPGRMYRTAFLKRRLHPKNLSRALEDSGTVTSALIPWNTCGAQMTSVLGISTLLYWKFAFLNLLCPLVSILYGVTGFTIAKISAEEAERRLQA